MTETIRMAFDDAEVDALLDVGRERAEEIGAQEAWETELAVDGETQLAGNTVTSILFREILDDVDDLGDEPVVVDGDVTALDDGGIEVEMHLDDDAARYLEGLAELQVKSQHGSAALGRPDDDWTDKLTESVTAEEGAAYVITEAIREVRTDE